MQLQTTQLEFPTLDLAWQGINEYIVNNEEKVRANGGSSYGTELVVYDAFLHIYKAKIPDDFNFGLALGYKYKKWSKLVNNYVNFNYLDLVRSEVISREAKKSKHYNFTFHFDNSHGSGKDCLISLTYCRRKGQDNPFVIYHTRASEVTSRLIFDFLLIQRLVEYVYGKENNVEVVCYIPFMFLNIERFLIYLSYRGIDKVKVKNGKPTLWQERTLQKYKEFSEKPLELIKYKIHKRVAMQVKKDKKGVPISYSPDLFAKDLTLPYKKKLKDKDIEKLNKDI